jgi:hypothetical protein
MAKAFSDEFNSKLTIAAGKPVEAARQAAEAAQVVADKAADANAAALAEIDRLIAGANKALSGKLPSSFVPGIQEKLGGFEALRSDILAGQVRDISAITSGMTSADAAAALRGTGGTTVNNYYEVKYGGSGNLVSDYQSGVAFADGLKTAATTNPQLQFEVFGTR